MRKCKNCGNELMGNEKFCTKCGTMLEEKIELMVRPELKSKGKFFYFMDVIQEIGKQLNVPVLLYALINLTMISMVTLFFADFDLVAGIISGIVLYALSLVIALSTLGEKILCFQNKCTKIEKWIFAERFLDLFDEACEIARSRGLDVSEDIQLYVRKDESSNAVAVGRNTIIISESMVELTDNEIIANFLHEISHISNHDADYILLITVSNFVITGVVLFIRFVCVLVCKILELISIPFVFFSAGTTLCMMVFVPIIESIFRGIISTFMWIWTKLGVLLVLKSRKAQEYKADMFVVRMGYRDDFITFLRKLEMRRNVNNGLFTHLQKSHPSFEKRMKHMGAF